MKALKGDFERRWKGLPVVDATEPLRLVVTLEDIATATRKNPGCCALANCCARSFGSLAVAFFAQKAYVEIPNEDGDVRVERFDLPTRTRAFVAAFDAGKSVATGSYLLTSPRPAERLGSQSKKLRSATWRAKKKSAAKKPAVFPRGSRRLKKVATVIRNGTGRIHFSKSAAKGKTPA